MTEETARSKTPLSYKKQVDTTKLNLPVIKRWIEEQLNEQLPEDDIAPEFIHELVAGEENPDIIAIESQVDEFLGKKESRSFCKQLWKLLLGAQEDKDGIPEELVEQRRKILEEQKKANEENSRPNNYGRNRGWYHRDRRDGYKGRAGRKDHQRRNNDQEHVKQPEDDDMGKTNYNRSSDGKPSRRELYEEDHHDARERGPRDRTLL